MNSSRSSLDSRIMTICYGESIVADGPKSKFKNLVSNHLQQPNMEFLVGNLIAHKVQYDTGTSIRSSWESSPETKCKSFVHRSQQCCKRHKVTFLAFPLEKKSEQIFCLHRK